MSLTVRKTLVLLFAACGPQDREECAREVNTQTPGILNRKHAREECRTELAAMESEGLVECEWVSLEDEPDSVDGDGYHAFGLTPAGYALAATY